MLDRGAYVEFNMPKFNRLEYVLLLSPWSIHDDDHAN